MTAIFYVLLPVITAGLLVQSPVEGGSYLLGAHDQIEVRVFEDSNLNTPLAEVDAGGMVSLTFIGPIKAAGKSALELEKDITAAFKARSLKDPHVNVLIRQRSSRPVSIGGAVRSPQSYQMDRSWSLFDLIVKAGGFAENVGKTIQVRRASDGSVLSIDVSDVENFKPAANIPLQANDSISVSLASWIVVGGEVTQPKQIYLTRGRTITVREAITLSGNPTREAKKKGAVIIRKHEGRPDEEILVDLDKIQKGQAENVVMADYDYLFIPSNKAKSILGDIKSTALSIAVGRAMYW